MIMPESGVSYGCVLKIIHDELHMSNVSVHFVLSLLTPLQVKHGLTC